MLKKLSVYQFKNYSKQSFEFDKSICCFYGPNGVGKTNILDAIYYLCFTKSYFSSFDHQVIQQGKLGMYSKGTFADAQIDCIIRETGKKEIKLNGELYEKNANHIGKFPAVIIAPDDTILVNGHSDVRRRFLDILLSQQNATYLKRLINYNKYLAQRNALLKLNKTKVIDGQLHNFYKEKLSTLGAFIYAERKKIIAALLPITQQYYKQIAQTNEVVHITYNSQLSEYPLSELFVQNDEKDYYTQRTNAGTHKDDLAFTIDGFPMKQHASQGQKKSFLFAIKLAEYTLLKDTLHQKPILLLDDIFEKLDEKRSQYLVNLISKLNTQIFVTDTHEERLYEAFKERLDHVQFINIVQE